MVGYGMRLIGLAGIPEQGTRDTTARHASRDDIAQVRSLLGMNCDAVVYGCVCGDYDCVGGDDRSALGFDPRRRATFNEHGVGATKNAAFIALDCLGKATEVT